jgi:hypothetical protein
MYSYSYYVLSIAITTSRKPKNRPKQRYCLQGGLLTGTPDPLTTTVDNRLPLTFEHHFCRLYTQLSTFLLKQTGQV